MSSIPSGLCRRTILASLLLAAAVVATFGFACTFDFVSWDDPQHLALNPHVWPAESRDLGYFWRHAYADLYVPLSYMWFGVLTIVSEAISNRQTGPHLLPQLFHAGNILLHIVNVVLVLSLLMRVGCSRRGAFCGAILFAVHPLQVESVAWISEARGLLAAAGCLIALICYVRAWNLRIVGIACADASGSSIDQSTGKASGTRSHSRFWYVAALVACAAALLCKPSATALPLLLAALEWGAIARTTRLIAAQRIAPFFGLAIASAVITKMLQHTSDAAATSALWERPVIALDAIAFYLQKLIVPLNLGIDYGLSPEKVLDHPEITGMHLMVVIALGLVLLFFAKPRVWLAAGAIFLAALAPTLGLVPFEFQRYSTVADRYAYLALLGPALAIAALPSLLPQAKSWLAIACIGAACLCSVLSLRQAAVWRNDLTLYEAALEVNPRSVVAAHNLGEFYRKQGEFDGAERFFHAVLKIQRGDRDAMLALGNTARNRFEASEPKNPDHLEDAIEWGERTVATHPTFADAYVNLGIAYGMIGRMFAAETNFRRALEIGVPDEASVRLNLAQSLAAQRKYEDAERECRRAIKLAPHFEAARDLLGMLQSDPGRRLGEAPQAP